MDKSFIDVFEEQVLKTPGNIAVVFEQDQLSYLQLNEQANMLASYLRSKGVKDETLVPLYIEPGINMLAAMLGIMKAGGAYVPLDTGFPSERIDFMLQDTGATIVVSSRESRSKLPRNPAIDIVDIENIPDQPKDNLATRVLPGQLAYLIYTSGSTGTPKGVMIEHGSLVDYVTGLVNKTQIDECRSFALVSTIATDLGNTVIFGSLAVGGALHLFTKESVSNIEFLHGYFTAHAIECLKIVPSHWKALNMDDSLLLPLKLLVFGGEALPAKLVEDIRLSGAQCRIVNHYGPTETTIGKLLYIVEPGSKYEYTVPIGKPFSNTKLLVLTKNLKLCPIGVPGQLYITGDGLARGYLNNAALTKEKFIENPFSKEAYSRMYSTGDLVKYLPDGNIVFIGRADNQVKIRGYRIELGEIENVLQKCEAVSQAVVLASDDKQGNKRLTGYVVPEGSFDREAILSYLKNKLPDYMVPALIMEMESFPLTANGKVDRNALPDPDASGLLSDHYTPPRNEVEAKLAELWQDVLEVDLVGVYDDFFELGGHSLLAVRLVSVIRKAFVVEMPISDIFDYPTIALLAAQLANNTEIAVLKTIEAVTPRPDQIPLSFSQERLWFIDRMEGSIQYHLPAVLRLKGLLNKDALAYALQQVVNRHEVLRTVFREKDGLVSQLIKEKDEWELTAMDSAANIEDPEKLLQQIHGLTNTPFDLANDHMLRASLIRCTDEEHVLVTTIHHIASDGWSTSILVKEVAELYQSYEKNRPAVLLPLALQYADFAIWQKNYLQGAVLDKKIGYWKEKLQGVAPLQLPTDFKRPILQSRKGSITGFWIDKTLSTQLQHFSQSHGATIFMTLLAAFKTLLYRYSGQEDICVGTPVAGRQQQELEGLIGFFVNTVALRTEVNGGDSFKVLLQKVRTTTLEAYAHQDIPFEKVLEAVVKERDMGRSPLFQVLFIMRNTPEVPELSLGDVQLSREQYEHTTAQFDITLIITETADGLFGEVEYATDLYSKLSIDKLIAHFNTLLHSFVASPELTIGALPMLTNEEELELLVTFNDTKTEFPKNKTLIGLFEEQVEKTPGSIAVIFEDQQYSFGELNERANGFAHYLRSRGVEQGALVPICIERCVEMIIGILAILKTGAAYIPIDADYPEERIRFMVEDSGSGLLVMNKKSPASLKAEEHLQVIYMEGFNDSVSWPSGNLSRSIVPDGVVLVIYTSGSSGRPKGAILGNDGIVNRLYWMWDAYPFGKDEKCLLKTSIGFGDHIWEIFGPLSKGITTVLLKKEDLLDLDQLVQKLSVHKISRLVLVPSLLRVLLDKMLEENIRLEYLQYLTCSGEAITSDLIADYYKLFPAASHKLLNIYGASEVTADITCYDTSIDFINLPDTGDMGLPGTEQNTLENNPSPTSINNKISIGKPIANGQVYIVDNGDRLVAKGVTGEILVGGVPVAQGYLNLPELTAEKFVANPFSKEPGSRVYRTGDLGCWLSDGNIAYLGRKDAQVKIRGYRIELEEIERLLQQSNLVTDVVVMAKEDQTVGKRLVGYVVPDGVFDKDAVQAYLKTRLPDYMVPAVWVVLDTMPLNHSGKLDKKALPEPVAAALSGKEYVAPTNETEAKLAAIWQEVLHLQRVGIHDNFFGLGGHSLMVIKMVSLMKKQFNLLIPIPVIFQFPTIHELGSYLDWENDAGEKADDDTTTYELINL